MAAITDVLILLATDTGFADSFSADPSAVAAKYGLSTAEVEQLLALKKDSGSVAATRLGQRISKSAIGGAGMSSLFHGLGSHPVDHGTAEGFAAPHVPDASTSSDFSSTRPDPDVHSTADLNSITSLLHPREQSADSPGGTSPEDGLTRVFVDTPAVASFDVGSEPGTAGSEPSGAGADAPSISVSSHDEALESRSVGADGTMSTGVQIPDGSGDSKTDFVDRPIEDDVIAMEMELDGDPHSDVGSILNSMDLAQHHHDDLRVAEEQLSVAETNAKAKLTMVPDPPR